MALPTTGTALAQQGLGLLCVRGEGRGGGGGGQGGAAWRGGPQAGSVSVQVDVLTPILLPVFLRNARPSGEGRSARRNNLTTPPQRGGVQVDEGESLGGASGGGWSMRRVPPGL